MLSRSLENMLPIRIMEGWVFTQGVSGSRFEGKLILWTRPREFSCPALAAANSAPSSAAKSMRRLTWGEGLPGDSLMALKSSFFRWKDNATAGMPHAAPSNAAATVPELNNTGDNTL